MKNNSRFTKTVRLAATGKSGKPNFASPDDLRYHFVESDVFTGVTFQPLFHRRFMNDVMHRLWTGGSFRSTGTFQILFYDGFSFDSLEQAYGSELYEVTLTRMLHEIETRLCLHDPVALVRGLGVKGGMPTSSLKGLRPHSVILNKPRLGSYLYDTFRTTVKQPTEGVHSKVSQIDKEPCYEGCILVFERKDLYDLLRSDFHRFASRTARKAVAGVEVQNV